MRNVTAQTLLYIFQTLLPKPNLINHNSQKSKGAFFLPRTHSAEISAPNLQNSVALRGASTQKLEN